MLDKSGKNAVVMGTIAVLSLAIVGQIIEGKIKDVLPIDWSFAFMVCAVILYIGITSYVIYKDLDESHFGPQGAIRWAIFGTVWALLAYLIGLLYAPPDSLIIDTVISFVELAIEISLSYWLAFKLFPPTREQD